MWALNWRIVGILMLTLFLMFRPLGILLYSSLQEAPEDPTPLEDISCDYPPPQIRSLPPLKLN